MSIRKIMENYKKELKNKLLVMPGERLRKNCDTYNCPMYIMMMTFNNLQIGLLPEKIVCTKEMCDRIKQGVFKCSLSDNTDSVFAGFFVDGEYISYEALFSRDCLPSLGTLIESAEKEVPSKQIEAPKQTVKPLEEILDETDSKDFTDIDSVKNQFIEDLDKYFGSKQTKSYLRINGGTLVFTNPVETDLTKITMKIPFDGNFDYKQSLFDLKKFYEGVVKLSKKNSCDNCSHLPEKKTGMSIACGSCTRNAEIELLRDIPKQDNYA